MPEARGLTIQRGGRVEDVVDGFWIRRAASPVAAAGLRRLHTFFDDKENIPPRRSDRHMRSPLPGWYPRTPLRDITAIVNALRRKRIRMNAVAARQMSVRNESSPQPTSPLPQEPSVSNQTPSSQDAIADIADPSPHPMSTATLSTPSERSLHGSSTLTSFSPIEQSTETSLLSTNLPPNAAKAIESGKKLLSSIDEIERVVTENVKRTAKGPAEKAKRTSTLLLMR